MLDTNTERVNRVDETGIHSSFSHYTEISRSSVEDLCFKRNVTCMYIDLQIRLRE